MENSRIARSLDRLHSIMKVLRSPGGCPWDALQTTGSLRPYLLEETYELLEAMDSSDPQQIRDELGDLLLQIVFHAQIFAEQDIFDLADVAEAISDKLERRHPHVFGEVSETDLEALNRQWDRIKAGEKPGRAAGSSPFAGIPNQLPALARAAKFIERGRRRNLPWATFGSSENAMETARSSCTALATSGNDAGMLRASFGEFLIATVAWGQSLGLDAEQSLRQTLDEIAVNLGSEKPSIPSHERRPRTTE